MRSTSLILCAALGLAACDEATTEPVDSTQTERQAIGKADLAGSCKADDCGGQAASGNCWCDSDCEGFGDCCENVAFVCEAPAPSCDDGSKHSPYCDMPPVCAAGTVKALQRGCFVCVDPGTCAAPAPAPSCDDGSTHSPLCDMPPVCAEGTVKALQHGCFVCVDPQTCEAPATPVPDVCAAQACSWQASNCPGDTECIYIESCATAVCMTKASACGALECADLCDFKETLPMQVTCYEPE